jgi:(2Fe-2S) ferredoxin
MPRIETLKDLTRLRDDVQRARTLRLRTGTTIYIGMGTCGVAAGAAETLKAIQAELGKRKIAAQVEPVGCIGMCVREPLVDIQQAGQPRVTYANIQAERVPRLIEEHLVRGRPVKEWVVGRLPTE